MTESRKNGDANSRRAFLKSGAVAAAAGAATLAMPNVARAQEAVIFKFQSTWPAKDIFHEFAADFVTRVNDMGGRQLKLELLAAGAVAKALEVQDAVLAGTLDGGHGVTAYWYGKHKAYSLFGTPPAWGWRANQMLGWIKYGGGQALYDELVQQVLGLNLVGFLTGPMPTQPLGWFKQEITDAAQLTGLKYRTVGLSADLFKEMGAAVTIMGGGEIVPAMDRGLLDAAEFNNPSSDKLLGFPDVSKDYMLQSYHQSAECFEIIFNKTKFDALAPDLQAIIKYAVEVVVDRHELEGDGPLFQGPRGAESSRRQGAPDAGFGAAGAARGMGQGDRGAVGRSVLRQGGRKPEGLGQARRRHAVRHGSRPEDGLRPLLQGLIWRSSPSP